MVFFTEFKKFAMRGNVVDMAVGIIIGAAFGKIVSSLVSDIIMPPLGLLIGGIDFTSFSVMLKKATETAPAVTLNYGMFIQNIFDFLIVAFSIFLLIKFISSFKKKQEEKGEALLPTKQEVLLAEIRDILKKK